MQHLGRTFVWVWLFWLFLCQGQETTFTLCQGHHYSFRNESLHRERQLNTGCWSYNWRAKWAVNWLSWRGDKSRPWDNNVMQPIIYLSYNWSLKKTLLSFHKCVAFPPSFTQHNVENQKKLQLILSFQHCIWGGGRGKLSYIRAWQFLELNYARNRQVSQNLLPWNPPQSWPLLLRH